MTVYLFVLPLSYSFCFILIIVLITIIIFIIIVIIIINSFTFILTGNLALRKTAAQSTTHNGSSGAENAVDGNRNPLFDANGNCALTNQGDPSWWQVDLGTNRVPVSDVFVVNRLFPTSAQKSNGDYEITLGEK